MKYLGEINNEKSIINKGYADSNYYSQEDASALAERLRVVSILASESDFKAEANFRAFKYGFDYLCIEPFDTMNDIDSTLGDGASVSEYFDEDAHVINKTSTDTMTIYSRKFSIDTTPYDALILVDYDGEGSVSVAFSKNDGEDWTDMTNDTLTSINALIQKNVRVKVVMNGKVRLKNIAWGCK